MSLSATPARPYSGDPVPRAEASDHATPHYIQCLCTDRKVDVHPLTTLRGCRGRRPSLFGATDAARAHRCWPDCCRLRKGRRGRERSYAPLCATRITRSTCEVRTRAAGGRSSARTVSFGRTPTGTWGTPRHTPRPLQTRGGLASGAVVGSLQNRARLNCRSLRAPAGSTPSGMLPPAEHLWWGNPSRATYSGAQSTSDGSSVSPRARAGGSGCPGVCPPRTSGTSGTLPGSPLRHWRAVGSRSGCRRYR